MTALTRRWPLGLGRRTWPLYLAGLAIILAALLTVDHPLSVFAHGQSSQFIAFFNDVTRWGESDWILIPSAVLLVVSAALLRLVPRRTPKLALLEMVQLYGFIFVGVGLPSLVANLVKRLVGRARPEMFDASGLLNFRPVINDYGSESWPSGHTTTAFALALVVGFLAPRWFFLGLVYAVAILLSRLVVGAHYPTDVLSGALLGTLGAYWVRNLFAARRWGFAFTPAGDVVWRPAAATRRLVRPRQRKPAR